MIYNSGEVERGEEAAAQEPGDHQDKRRWKPPGFNGFKAKDGQVWYGATIAKAVRDYLKDMGEDAAYEKCRQAFQDVHGIPIKRENWFKQYVTVFGHSPGQKPKLAPVPEPVSPAPVPVPIAVPTPLPDIAPAITDELDAMESEPIDLLEESANLLRFAGVVGQVGGVTKAVGFLKILRQVEKGAK